MDLFHEITDEIAIVRVKGGTYRQTKVYRRGSNIYVGIGQGFVRVLPKYGAALWGTSNPNVSVVDMSAAMQHMVGS